MPIDEVSTVAWIWGSFLLLRLRRFLATWSCLLVRVVDLLLLSLGGMTPCGVDQGCGKL